MLIEVTWHLSSVVSRSTRISDPVDLNIPTNWWIQFFHLTSSDHRHWEIFFSNVTNVTTNTLLRGAQGLKKISSSNATNVTKYLVLRETWGLTRNVFSSNATNVDLVLRETWWLTRNGFSSNATWSNVTTDLVLRGLARNFFVQMAPM